MENEYGLYSPGSSGWTWLKDREFQEEDVWGVFQEIEDTISRDSTSYMSKGLHYPARSIPNPNKNSYAGEPEITQRRSTPIRIPIPDWPKIYGTSCPETYNGSCFWLDADSNNIRGFARNRWGSDIEEEEYDDGEFEGGGAVFIPPHVWIAKKLRPSSSVCEGAGRTLKGRDLLSVRNDVLTKTGFLESKTNRW